MSNLKVTDDQGRVWTVDIASNTRTMTDEAGKLVTMDLGVSDVHIDAALATYASGYMDQNSNFIADKVMPVLPVDKATNKFFAWDKADVFQPVQNLAVAADGAVQEFSPRLSTDSYATTGYAAASFVSTELQANSDSAVNPEMMAIKRCMAAIMLQREFRVANLLTGSGNWSGGYTTTIAAGAKWNGGASSNPISDIFTAMQSSYTDVSAIVMSELVYQDFIQNAAVQKYIASKTAITPLPSDGAQFSAILQLPPIVVARRKAILSSGSLGYIWGNNVVLVKAEDPIPTNGETVSTARTFRWTGAGLNAPDGTMQGGFLVRSYYDPKRGPRGGRMVVVTHNDAEKMTSVFAGGLIISAHQ